MGHQNNSRRRRRSSLEAVNKEETSPEARQGGGEEIPHPLEAGDKGQDFLEVKQLAPKAETLRRPGRTEDQQLSS